MVVKRKSEIQLSDTLVVEGQGEPYYYYTLDLVSGPSAQATKALLDEGKRAASRVQDIMSEDDLHVTMWYKQVPGPDKDYYDRLIKDADGKVFVECMYSDGDGTAVAAVTLSPKLNQLLKTFVPAHVSVCKKRSQEWQDLGRLAWQGRFVTDWKPVEDKTFYSERTGLTKKCLNWTVRVKPAVHIDTSQ